MGSAANSVDHGRGGGKDWLGDPRAFFDRGTGARSLAAESEVCPVAAAVFKISKALFRSVA